MMTNKQAKNDDEHNYRVVKFVIKDYQHKLDKLTRKAKCIYNASLYQIRQTYLLKHKWLSYAKLNRYFKKQAETHACDLYRQMIYVQSAQQTIREVVNVWSAWHKALKAYYKKPSKFTGKPRMPKYIKKTSHHPAYFTNQNASIKNGYLHIRKLPWLIVKMPPGLTDFKRVEIKPLNNGKFMVMLQYDVGKLPKLKDDNGIYVGIDPGVDNALACATNKPNVKPLLISGKIAKSINQYYNKRIACYNQLHADYRQCCQTINTKQGKQLVYSYSQKQLHIANWRNSYILEFAHKASKRVIDYALNCGANTIVIGKNVYWKKSSNLKKKVNQNFIGLPHAQMIDLIKYKSEQVGINVICHSESYTSQTSFLDNEKPCWDNGNKARVKQINALKANGFTRQELAKRGLALTNRRIQRGLFKSNQGYLINADVNAALQIIKKVFPEVSPVGIGDDVFYPVKWIPRNLIHLTKAKGK